MNSFEKNNTLTLYRILMSYTDESHRISMKEILNYMAQEDCACSKDSVHRYIKQLRNEIGVDIVTSRGRNSRYYIGERLLENEELKLIIDAVNASNFIEKSIAKKMVDKLKQTVSIFEGQKLERSVLGINNAKAENRRILYNVNQIQEALAKGVQISFDYLGWNKEKKLIKKSNHRYDMNPWALIWANDRYYLHGYDIKKTDGVLYERNYRVDKLDNIKLTDIPRKGKEQFNSFDANTYVSRRMGMFTGNEEYLTVKIPKYLVGAFIDQYGKEIIIKEISEEQLEITFKTVLSDIFIGWLVGLRAVEVVKPLKARQKVNKLLEDNIQMYSKKN